MSATKASRGRPRQFDIEVALEKALKLFWQYGYEGTSVAALSEAIGINIPSLYSAFGDKEALFDKVVERYIAQYAIYIKHALMSPTAREVVQNLLNGAVAMVDNPENPNGCMIVQGALVTNPQVEAIRQKLSKCRGMAESMLAERFEMAKTAREIPTSADCTALARFVMTFNWGNAVQSASGVPRERLEENVKMAMIGWDAIVATS